MLGLRRLQRPVFRRILTASKGSFVPHRSVGCVAPVLRIPVSRAAPLSQLFSSGAPMAAEAKEYEPSGEATPERLAFLCCDLVRACVLLLGHFGVYCGLCPERTARVCGVCQSLVACGLTICYLFSCVAARAFP